MEIMQFIFFLWLITIVSGGSGYCIWKVLEKTIGEKYPELCYGGLKLVSVFLLLPITGCMVKLFYEGNTRNMESIWKCEFMVSPWMDRCMQIFILIWMFSAGRFLYSRWRAYSRWRRIRQWNRKIEEYETISHKVIRRMGIPKMPDVYRNPLLHTPVIYGVMHPVVVLPKHSYSDDEVEMIFFHEFSHYKNADLFWKYFVGSILVFHCINPFIKNIQRSLDKWGEICCDLTVKKYAKDEFFMKDYYSIILDQIAQRSGYISIKRDYVDALFEKRCEIKERMIIVKNQMEKRKWKGLKEVCVGMLFVIVFFTTTYLTGVGVQAGADVLYDKTADEVDISNEYTSVEEMEYMEEVDNEDNSGYEIIEMRDQVSRSTNNINWTVGSKQIAVSSYFSLQKGDKIKLRIMLTPDDQVVKAGYQMYGASAVTVKGANMISHTFTVSKTGKYRIYIKNPGMKKIRVIGSYSR